MLVRCPPAAFFSQLSMHLITSNQVTGSNIDSCLSNSLWQPDDLGCSREALESHLYVRFCEVGVAVGVQQALLSGEQRPAGTSAPARLCSVSACSKRLYAACSGGVACNSLAARPGQVGACSTWLGVHPAPFQAPAAPSMHQRRSNPTGYRRQQVAWDKE
eukprot:GHRQ01027556.1.p2 GENE.GHRQ01027556.1~~GHRQ01027556.1.p2  ORF type:complete len:160 (+),score=25.38 GHRQ01027556.1:254-733(+)